MRRINSDKFYWKIEISVLLSKIICYMRLKDLLKIKSAKFSIRFKNPYYCNLKFFTFIKNVNLIV
jgi:hypothetical protein